MRANESDAVYAAIMGRRDVRCEFNGEPLEEAALGRLLSAAHAAPSVGLTQPWDFVVVRDSLTRQRFRDHVTEERQKFAATLSAERAGAFSQLKVEGILEATLSVVVTYDSTRGAPDVLGRHAIADAGLYSVCLAIENLWLAATVDGYGVGWVSFYREAFLSELLGIPGHVRPVAWLCIGPVSHRQEVPDLERHGWRRRRPLRDAVHLERW